MKTKLLIGSLLLLAGVAVIGIGSNAQDEAAPVVAPPAKIAPATPTPAPAPATAQPDVKTPAAADAATVPAGDTAAVTPTPASSVLIEEPVGKEGSLLQPPEDKEPIAGAKATTNAQNAELITVALEDMEMVDVVRMFTRISQANIITSPSNLHGRVTVNLTEVEWKPALDSILDMHKLALIEKTPGSGVFSIIAKPEGQPEPLLVETFFLKYAPVAQVQAVILAMLAGGGKVTPFPSRNALVVRTTAANLGEVKQIVERIDRLRDQVFIEAKFMELNDEAIKNLGINWQVLQAYNVGVGNMKMDLNNTRTWDQSRKDASSQWDKRQNLDKTDQKYDVYGVQYEESVNTTTLNPITGLPDTTTTRTPTRTITDTIDKGKNITSDITDSFLDSTKDIRTAVLGVDDFKLTLSALKQMSGVSIVSNPKIIVANEEPATIHIGQTERPFVSSVTPGQQGIAPVVTYNPGEAVELGVKLTVTPTVNTASNITVKIQPELTRFLRDAVAPNGQTYPVVGTKKITTVFCLESGKTVAIGGLTETDDRDVTTKIPLLGDIPLIGKYLFSHTHKQKSQQETIIFVTVGLALPDGMDKEAGLPENTELTRRQLIDSQVRRAEFLTEIEKVRQAREAEAEKKAQKTRNRLLKKSN